MLPSKVLPVGDGLKVLSVGYERELLQLRSLLLRQTLQVDVEEAVDLKSALKSARNVGPVALVLLCHTVPSPHQQLIIEAARARNAQVAILSIFAGMCFSDGRGRPVSNNPQQLLAAVREALSGDGTRTNGHGR